MFGSRISAVIEKLRSALTFVTRIIITGRATGASFDNF